MFRKKILHIWNTKKLVIIPVVILNAFFLLQIPFLNSDPDLNISFSRGANTDEGLHSCQVRNYINVGDWTMDKSDNLVKTPLFGLFIFLVLSCFGSKLLIGRLAILLSSILIFFFSLKQGSELKKYSLFLIPILFLQYHVFHFFHYCLAEILCSIFILSSIFYTVYSSQSRFSTFKKPLLSAILISIPYFLKIQFFYIITLLPIYYLGLFLFDRENRGEHIKPFFYLLLFLGIGVLIYVMAWYIPNKDLFHYVMLDQTNGRFATIDNFWNNIRWIHDYFFMSFGLKHLTISFYVAFPLGLVLFFKSKSRIYKHLFFGLSIWLILESHKLGMTYLPSRYFISFIFPMGGIVSLVLFESWKILKERNRLLVLIPFAILLIIFTLNAKNYIDSYSRRVFVIKELNQYFSSYDLEGKKIIGPWAPSLTWQTKAVSYPVWNGYFNSDAVFEEQKPSIIISEKDEKDSNYAYSSKGINIKSKADSIIYKKVNNWDLKILWMKE